MKNNSKQSIKNKDADAVFKKWKQGKGDLLADIKKDSIMFKRESTVNKPIWTKEQSEYLDNKFGAIDKRFESIDKKFDAIDKRFEAIDKKFDAIDKRFEAIDKRFEAIDKKFDAQDKKLDMLIDLIKDVSNKLDKHISEDHRK